MQQLVNGVFFDRSKAQRIQQGAEYQLAQKQAIGPSHEGEKCPVRGLLGFYIILLTVQLAPRIVSLLTPMETVFV